MFSGSGVEFFGYMQWIDGGAQFDMRGCDGRRGVQGDKKKLPFPRKALTADFSPCYNSIRINKIVINLQE